MTNLDAIDERVLIEIDRIRAVHHSCTLGQISNRLHISKDLLRTRCLNLKKRGLVDWTGAHGSLHRIEDLAESLFQRALVLRILEYAQRGSDMIDEWCRDLVEDVRQEIGGDVDEQRGVPVDAAPSPATASQTVPGNEMRCEPCGRDFKGKGAIDGHRTSKAHLARVAELAAAP